MEIIRGLHNLSRQKQGCVATIGNFDGVHSGHQHILAQLAEKAQASQLPSIVITFEPQPQEFFVPQRSPARLTRFRDKAEVIADCGIDKLLVIHFNESFSQLSAEHFVQQILVDKLGIRYLQVGDDFQFGKGRSGSFATLLESGKEFDFDVENTPTFSLDNERVSSTCIRQALETGNMELTRQLLNRPYWMSGHIQHGAKRGRTIGFPTANVPLHRETPAVSGVFAVRLWGKDLGICKETIEHANDASRQGINGIANIGYRPTVDGQKGLLEVHLFDFKGDLYGKLVHVDFLHKIRDEMKFDSFEILKEQILKDVVEANAYFSK
ncbi:MAG: bifunctional riboflavin kinase/FAD synthetase [gamma proteobacterium symbiont of Bathyaustriella thionipta]|nr:bifunctional riboflavin kinase/FAD synthetase [gamma proteobacterium symbiont of Bathyaustriella thionipta]MCU7949581.1 bifunctional riboflavin kinase/FAD synthetase [gamma proteobacterium symbiont of Bathyaustriella thionipta]MCU7952819.1 bifunctional riboflavin kinase/FAD synthetase [gamma proteobacterium symbiont of Bathyaustriella thionipta]MCU7956173.1 bifunctional riboflavin kinase/FAD synthetase [gamma proteobacterium symbiont of Bathyaustriella thionipta]MCU7967590.1 bifunctional rib